MSDAARLLLLLWLALGLVLAVGLVLSLYDPPGDWDAWPDDPPDPVSPVLEPEVIAAKAGRVTA